MRKLLNTLYISSDGAYIKKEGEALILLLKDGTKHKLPIINLEGIVCIGNILATPYILAHCCEIGITVSFLSSYGKFLCKVNGPIAGNVLLRKKQYHISEQEEESLTIVKATLVAKILNSRLILQRNLHDYGDETGELKNKIALMAKLSKKVVLAKDINEGRGIEGLAANYYFDYFDNLVRKNKEAFKFTTRNRRPPMDRINAMLSFGYNLLYHDCISALEIVGLDPAVGFLHKDRPGRLSLALDLMEEFRAIIVDRMVINMINLDIVTPEDFTISESGAVLMKDNLRKTLIATYQAKKREETTHTYLNEKLEMGLVIYAQSLLLARYLRGDIDAYPAFISK